MSSNPKNPVLKTVHGVDVKKYNYVNIMFSANAFEDLLEQAFQTNLSVPKLIAIKSQPCQQCQCDNVTLVIAKDGRVTKQSNGENIISKNRK